MPHNPPIVRDDLREALASLDVLPGFRAEWWMGRSSSHRRPTGSTRPSSLRSMTGVRETHGLRLHRNLALICPEGEYVPDGIAAAKGAFAGRDWHSKPDGVVMVLEGTSGDNRSVKSAERDRGPKRIGYASAGIPLYLLVDRLDGKVTIFAEPRGREYGRSASVTIGDQLAVPAPLKGVLDTHQFL
jgi:Putative restriction endonuclease